MQRHRFYAPPAQIQSESITLTADEAHHLARVLRLGVGAQVFAFDGIGNEYDCRVAAVSKHEATLSIIAPLTDTVESPLQLTLAQALCKGDKFDLVVQKATELGVTRIVPLITAQSDIRLKQNRGEERTEQKLTRWRRIALEAVKQCGRRRLVEFSEPIAFPTFCAQNTDAQKLIFAEHGGQRLSVFASAPAANPTVTSITVAIGPEGGWSPAELQAAAQANFTAIHLGNRILRTETAAITAVALVQAHLGDLV